MNRLTASLKVLFNYASLSDKTINPVIPHSGQNLITNKEYQDLLNINERYKRAESFIYGLPKYQSDDTYPYERWNKIIRNLGQL